MNLRCLKKDRDKLKDDRCIKIGKKGSKEKSCSDRYHNSEILDENYEDARNIIQQNELQ